MDGLRVRGLDEEMEKLVELLGTPLVDEDGRVVVSGDRVVIVLDDRVFIGLVVRLDRADVEGRVGVTGLGEKDGEPVDSPVEAPYVVVVVVWLYELRLVGPMPRLLRPLRLLKPPIPLNPDKPPLVVPGVLLKLVVPIVKPVFVGGVVPPREVGPLSPPIGFVEATVGEAP